MEWIFWPIWVLSLDSHLIPQSRIITENIIFVCVCYLNLMHVVVFLFFHFIFGSYLYISNSGSFQTNTQHVHFWPIKAENYFEMSKISCIHRTNQYKHTKINNIMTKYFWLIPGLFVKEFSFASVKMIFIQKPQLFVYKIMVYLKNENLENKWTKQFLILHPFSKQQFTSSKVNFHCITVDFA